MAPPIALPPLCSTSMTVSVEATHRELAISGALPHDMAGRLLGVHGDVVHCAEFHGGRLLTYRIHRVRHDTHADIATDNIVVFGGSILTFGRGSLAHELSSNLDTSTPVDLAGRSRRLIACPVGDQNTGDLHLLAAAPDRSEEREPMGELRPIVTGQFSGMKGRGATHPTSAQAHVVVSSGALTRRDRPIIDAPNLVVDLAVAGDRVLFASDGFLGIGSGDLDTPVQWIPTGVAAPALVHADPVDETVVAITVTPSLERWTIHPASSTIDREVLDPTPQRFARTNHERNVVRQLLWTIGDRTADTHDLATGRTAHRSFGRRRPGDFAFVADPQRPRDADGGWLVGFVHDGSGREADLVVLDAVDISRAAIAAVRIPQPIPVDLHTTWIHETSREPDQGDRP